MCKRIWVRFLIPITLQCQVFELFSFLKYSRIWSYLWDGLIIEARSHIILVFGSIEYGLTGWSYYQVVLTQCWGTFKIRSTVSIYKIYNLTVLSTWVISLYLILCQEHNLNTETTYSNQGDSSYKMEICGNSSKPFQLRICNNGGITWYDSDSLYSYFGHFLVLSVFIAVYLLKTVRYFLLTGN